jgi:tetratricopeptide (TPR) repeat protein
MSEMRSLSMSSAWILLATTLSLLPGCRFLPPYDHQKRGMEYFKKKDYDHARIEFAKAVRDDPKSLEARYYYGVASQEAKDFDTAGHSFLVAETMEGKQTGPYSLDIRLRLARLLYFAGDSEGTIRRCNWVLKRDPGNQQAKELLAFAFAAVSQPQKASTELEDVLTADPANLQARVLMASIKLAEQDRVEAEHQLLAAVEQTHRSPAALIPLANFYQVTGQREKAEATLLEAIPGNPQSTELRIALGWFYARTGRPEKAEAVFKELAAQHPKERDQRAMLSSFYFFEKDLGKAIQEMEAALQADRGDIATKNRLAGAYYLAGRFADSRRVTDELLKQDDQNLRARMVSALLMVEEGKNQESLMEYNFVLHFLPDSAPLHYFIGLAYQREHKSEVAQLHMEQALKLDKNLMVARLWMADYHLRTGAYDAAFGTLREAPDEQFKSPLLRLRLASAYQGLHRDAEACAEIRAILAVNGEWIPKYYDAGFGKVLDKCTEVVRQALEKELQLQPQSAPVLTSLAHLLAVSVSRKAAGARVLTQMQMVPGLDRSAPHLLLLANLATGLGQLSEARSAVQRAMESQPDSPDPGLALVQVEIASGHLDAAAKACEEVVKRWPNVLAGWLWLGSVRESLEDLPAATKAFEKALALNPFDSMAANNLAWRLASDDGDIPRAVTLAKRASNLQPDNLGFADTLGFALYKAKQLKQAKVMLEDVVQRDPRNAIFVYHLALVEKDTDDLTSALRDMERALLLNPRFPEAEQARLEADQLKRKLQPLSQ